MGWLRLASSGRAFASRARVYRKRKSWGVRQAGRPLLPEIEHTINDFWWFSGLAAGRAAGALGSLPIRLSPAAPKIRASAASTMRPGQPQEAKQDHETERDA